jgi:putative salt-induced outer membrane protein
MLFGGLEMKYLVKIVLFGTLLITSGAFAQDDADEEKKLGWSGTGELGLVNTTGNTKSFALNGKFEFVKTTERWRHRFAGTALVTSENGTEDNKRYTAEIQSDRKLSEKSWLFGVYRYDADKFGAYDPSQTATVGYGYQLMESEKHSLKGEIGGGWRKLKDRGTGLTSSEAIIRIMFDDSWQVFKTTIWTNRLLVETGSDNTFINFNTAAAIAMTDRFAVKIGFEVRNNSKLPPGDSEHTDTITTVNLVYGF